MTDFPTILYTSTSEIPTLSYTGALKGYHLRAEPPRIDHQREYPPPPPPWVGYPPVFFIFCYFLATIGILKGGRAKIRCAGGGRATPFAKVGKTRTYR